jgi:hypothetical protein
MRPAISSGSPKSLAWLPLLALALCAGGFLGSQCAAGQKRKAQAPAAVRPAPRPAEEDDRIVVGYGRTGRAAREVALVKAQARVEEELRQLSGPAGWRLTPAQLDPEHLTRLGVVREVGHNEEGERIKVSMRVELTPQYLSEVRQAARQEVVLGRLLLLARGLAGLVILLVVVAGYLRLEEATRGYYTGLLRLTAAAVVLLAGVGLWLSW